MTAPSRADAENLDAADPLRGFRDHFVIGAGPGDAVAYLDGNSLGRLPQATAERLEQVVRHEWGSRLIRAWDERWLSLPVEVGNLLGEAVLGAAAGQVVVADSTSVCLFKALHAAAALRPHRQVLVALDSDFPTDRYLVEAVSAQRGSTVRWVSPPSDAGVTADLLAPALDGDVAVVLLSHVDYRSAHLADMTDITRQVRDIGAVVVWDLSHSAGSVPVTLDSDGVDLAVGCTYKYLNGGPGSPAYIYVAARHHDGLQQPVPGWLGAADVFAMARDFTPAPGIERMLSGTPSLLGLVAVEEGVRLVAEAGIGAIRAKGVVLTDLVVALADEWLAPLGVTVASPRDPYGRGAHLVLRHPDARGWCERLVAAGVVGDFRNPDLWRVGLSPLTTSYAEVWDAMRIARGELAALTRAAS
ncbi:MAG: aminotransferase class V-fold PLP-dependent enzyme [Actinomycetota bacterium]|nr:aminotransferase class V-fold PLP-dependent enzyme [Actinomycetota bacterium]